MAQQEDTRYKVSNYLAKRKRLSGAFIETALPNEYLVQVGNPNFKPVLGASRLRLFRKFMRVPASVQTLYFTTDNANVDYQGIGIEGYASWRINPETPEVAIKTLDFYDADNPTARTNEELKTICVEAVRHVISNMSIADALKKKDEIAQNLKDQLKSIEKKWGIVFDQVGIEKVRIMSASLFEQMQSQYRDSLRLEVEKKRIATESDIAREQNITREKTELESLETDKKLNLVRVENDSRVKESSIAEKFKIQNKERTLNEENYRQEMVFRTEKTQKDAALTEEQFKLDITFRTEQAKKEHELTTQNLKLQEEQVKAQMKLLEAQKALELLKRDISLTTLEVERLKREVEQTYTSGALTNNLIDQLPQLFEAVKIQNYSVMNSGEGGLSPVGSFLTELNHLLKAGGLSEVLGSLGAAKTVPAPKPPKAEK